MPAKGECSMQTIIPKKQMTEEEIKLYYITPELQKKWKNFIRMEFQITDGRIDIRGNMVSRRSPKKADYVLYYNATPLAIVEAKDNKHGISDGLQQAMCYAQMLDVPFAYSSNGDAFMEHDFLEGKERELALSDFPTPEELYRRLMKGKSRLSGSLITAARILIRHAIISRLLSTGRLMRLSVAKNVCCLLWQQERAKPALLSKLFTACSRAGRLTRCFILRTGIFL